MPAHPLDRWCDVCQHVHPALHEPKAPDLRPLRDRIQTSQPIRLARPTTTHEEVQIR